MPSLISLRETSVEELSAVHEEEADPGTRCWLGDTSPGWHRGLLDAPDAEHLTLVRREQPVGFVVLAGLGDVNGSLELRRVLTYRGHRGQGFGRLAMIAALERAFTVHGAHRVWLDVKSGNVVARRLYASLGLAVEGELREVMLEPDGTYSSLVVMAVLDREWRRQPHQHWSSKSGRRALP
jgi:diamine N-acetyltransferase